MVSFEKTAILGVGLIGASLALAMRERSLTNSVSGFGRTEKNLRNAVDKGIIDSYDIDPVKACENADLIVLATPVGSFKPLTRTLKGHFKKNAIVIDVGSVKGFLVTEIENLMDKDVHYVACHPIAGSEHSGIDTATGGLFEGKLCLISRTDKTNDAAFEKVSGLWSAVGSRVELMDPELHDMILGLVSHLPHLAAFALVNSVADVDAGSLKYAGNGFKDTTRIALSSPLIWRDICAFNSENLLRFLNTFRANIEGLSRLLKEGDFEGLEEAFKRARKLRSSIEG